MKSRALLLGLFLTTAVAAVPVHAQANDGPPDFAEMRQRMMDRMKETIGVTDDEWKTIQPKIEKIQQLQRDVYPSGMGMMMGPPGGGPGGGGFGGGPGGPPPQFGGPGGGGPPSDVQEKLHDLRTALQDEGTAADDVKAKAQAYRDAKAAAKLELTKAQDELHQFITKQTQEAALLSMGILE